MKKAVLFILLLSVLIISGQDDFNKWLKDQEKDFTSANYLQWYFTEQIEEESTVRSILDQIKLAGTEGLFLMDKEFAAMATAKRAALALSGGANAVT